MIEPGEIYVAALTKRLALSPLDHRHFEDPLTQIRQPKYLLPSLPFLLESGVELAEYIPIQSRLVTQQRVPGVEARFAD